MDWSIPLESPRRSNVVSDLSSSRLLGKTDHTFDPFPSVVSRLGESQRLVHHEGCVNTIEWNDSGSTIITGSDDRQVGIWRQDSTGAFVLRQNIQSGHQHNIFCAKFVPETNDEYIVTCAADGQVRHFHAEPSPAAYIVNYRHLEERDSPTMMYHIEFLRATSQSFLACSQDGALIQYDLRVRTIYNKIYDSREEGHQRTRMGVTSFCFHPSDDYRYLVGCADLYVREFDFRNYKTVLRQYKPDDYARSKNLRGSSVTGVKYSPRGDEFAMNATGHGVYVVKMSPTANRIQAKETETSSHSYDMILGGHRNVQTFLKGVAYVGPEGSYISTGSDCGHVFLWSKHTGRVVSLMKGDDSVVNMVTPHPYVPMLATCGIDRDAKLFAPTMDPKSVRYNQQMIDDHLEFNFGISSSERDQSHYANFLKTALPHIRRPAQDGCDVFHSLPKDIPDLTAARALEISAIVKTRGNEYFKDDNIECAVQKYNKALRYVEIASTLGEDNRKDKIAILSNAALCLMKLRRYAAAAKHCTTVIGLDSNHVKSYFRRAHCNMQLGELSQASSDIEKAIQLSPQEDEIVKLQDIIQNLRQQQGQRDRARFSRLFRED